METERYVVRELEGYNIGHASARSNHARISLSVCVLDSRWNYRLVRENKSELDGGTDVGGHRVSRNDARRQVRADAAALAARLNEETP
jgi:hypothetical protein